MILYVSGPMTGKPGYNFPAFRRVANELRAAGFAVLNPAENFGGATDLPRATYIRFDIHQVLAAEGIALLPGWKKSRGARLEVSIANELELIILPWKEWIAA